MRASIRTAAVLSCLVAGSGPAWAASEPVFTDHLQSRLVAEHDAIVPGQPLRLGLLLVHDSHWHTYWVNSGDSGLPTRISWSLPEGYAAGPIEWPRPERLPVGPLVNYGYSGTIVLPVTLNVPAGLRPGTEVTLSAGASWLICEIECIPGDGQYTLTLPVRERADRDPRWRAEFERAAALQPRAAAAVEARFNADATRVRVTLAGAGLPHDAGGWSVFPVTPQVVANAAVPVWTRTALDWRFELPPSDAWAGAPERFDFVLARDDEALALSAHAAPDQASVEDRTTSSRGGGPGMLLALGMALLGGLILNLMPCVFPVLSLKALGAVESADDPRALRRHGTFYALGVVGSFLLVAIVLLGLRSAGAALGWGFQLQQPAFVAAMAMLFFVLALGLSGAYELGAGLAGMGQHLTEGRGDRGAFFTGVLACVVASPCTAPFMGSALGYALAQPAPMALPVFAALGLGMAMPMLLLGHVPALARWLPRPGPWMERLKQFLAFPLYLTVVWLAWVYGEQTSVIGIAWLLTSLVLLALGVWMLATARGGSPTWRILGLVVLLAGVALPFGRADDRDAGSPAVSGGSRHGEPWSEPRLAALRAAGTPVLVNMTAAWCITCLANERLALSTDRFAQLLDRHGVAYLKGNWTRGDAAITRFLESFGRSGVPLYVLYPGNGLEPIVLPQLLTPDIVGEAFAAIPARASP